MNRYDKVLVTGGFDPLHSGHIKLFKAAKEKGKKLIVGLNSDEWLRRKKGQPFMEFEEREAVISNLSMVDRVIEFDDSDDTANNAIYQLISKNNSERQRICFANGGDVTKENCKEYKVYGQTHHVQFEFGVGGKEKRNSSSWILDQWRAPKTEKKWGYYKVIHENKDLLSKIKVKELSVKPGESLSMQKHHDRSEHWFIMQGEATICTINEHNTDLEYKGKYKKHQWVNIDVDEWHMLINQTNKALKLIEIQFGKDTAEEDIERLDVSDMAIIGEN